MHQVTELSGQREDMVGLLGGYQSSIRELQDKHSVLVVRLQGENAALKAEVGRGCWGAQCSGQFCVQHMHVPPWARGAAAAWEERMGTVS